MLIIEPSALIIVVTPLIVEGAALTYGLAALIIEPLALICSGEALKS